MIDLKPWLIEEALPFWKSRGWDGRYGGVHEQMLWDGSPDLRAIKRVRVQARQIYVYSHAAELGWFPDGTSFALELLDWMLRKARAPDREPGFVHLLHPDGSVADHRRDTYDHMFILLALAWLARASGDAQVRGLVDQLQDFIDERLTARDGALFEGVPVSLPRRQNPHMHCFETMLALHETLEYPGALGRADKIRQMLVERFLSPAPKLREYFNDDWTVRPGPEGESVEPGHQAEWTWLLRRFEKLTNRAADPLASALLDDALKRADTKTGFLPDEADSRGGIRRATRRLWPQTELAKAWLAEAEIGRETALDRAIRSLEQLRDVYLAKPFKAGWIDQFGPDGEVVVDRVPASTLYHIHVAVVEADRVLAGQGAR